MTRARRFIIATIGIALGVGLAAFQLSRTAQDASLSHWQGGVNGYATGLREQISTGKPMAVLFYTDWCSNCKKLRETVLSTPEVENFLGGFITVKVNPEENGANQALADSFGVAGYPTFLVIPPGDQEPRLVRRTSNVTPQQFIAACREALAL